jgi:hypothetical protein
MCWITFLPPGVNPQPLIPFPSFARNATYETTNAVSSYNSLQATYEHQTSFGLYLLGNYTLSKCLSDQHTQVGQNQQYRAEWLPGFGIGRDYALCDSDAPHSVHIAGTYELPLGHGRAFLSSTNKAVDAVLGGWIVNGIYSYQSGQPFAVTCPFATTSDFRMFCECRGRARTLHRPSQLHAVAESRRLCGASAATAIGQTDYSPLGGGQGQARGPHFANLDSSVLKDFPFTESVKVEFRAEAFNTTNTPPFAQPTSQLNFTTAKFSTSPAPRIATETMGLARCNLP